MIVFVQWRRYVTLGLGCLSMASVGHSQTPEPGDALAEITITAEKRETNLQETPIAVSVIGGDDLALEHIQTVLDVTLPNTSINAGLEGKAQIAIRGLGEQDLNPGNEGRVAYYIDGVYVAAPEAQLGTFFDVDRVEVLRGPQGTLYGRNATGGAFNVFTRKPTAEDSGYVDVTIGNYDLRQIDGALSGPINDTLRGRIAFQSLDRAGYGTNLYLHQDIDDSRTQSLRAQLAWQPIDGLNVLLQGDYHRENDSNYPLHYFGYPVPGPEPILTTLGYPVLSFSRDENTDVQPVNRRNSRGLSLKTTYDISSHLQFTSVLAYRNSNAFNVIDDDGTPYVGSYQSDEDHMQQYSAEFQLTGAWTHTHWVAGLFYFRDTDTPSNRYLLNGLFFGAPPIMYQGGIQVTNLKTNAYAGFGEMTQDFTDRLSLTLGARYTKEYKDDNDDYQGFDLATPYTGVIDPRPAAVPGFPYSQSTSFSNFSPKLTLNYEFAADLFGYGTVSRGFKSGGFNWGSLQPNVFRPETVTDYELGLKSTFLDHKLRANIAAFYYDYTNIQSVIIVPNPNIPGFVQFEVSNAGAARSYGAELELSARPIPALQLDLTASTLHATYQKFASIDPLRPELGLLNLKGNRIPQSPDYIIELAAQYMWTLQPGLLSLRGDFKRVGNTDFSIFNCCGVNQPAYNWANASLTFEHRDNHWTGSAYVRNITDKVIVGGLFNQAEYAGSQTVGSQSPPRTYGLTLGYKW